MKSAFMSDVFHELKAGNPFVSPVSERATMWLMSVDRLAANVRHALTCATATGAFTLPAVRTTMSSLVAEIAIQTGANASLVAYAPDAALEAAFGSQPPLETPCADSLGFAHDGSIAALLGCALKTSQGQSQ